MEKKFSSQKHLNPWGYVSLNKRESISLFGCWNAQKSLQKNAIEEGWSSIQLPITKAKSVYVHYTSISRSSTMSQTWTSVFQIQIAVLCGNCILNFPMLNWSNSTEMIFQKCDLCKRYEEVSVTSLLCSTGILGHHLLQPRCQNKLKEWAGQYTTKFKHWSRQFILY